MATFDEASVHREMFPPRRRASDQVSVEELLAGGGETGALMRTLDWANTMLGPVHEWPQSLRTALSITMSSRFPITLYWGPEFLMLYNDDLLPMVGANKHPWALGRPAFEVLPEIRTIIEPLLRKVMDTAEAIWSEDLMLPLQRGHAPEESYFTFSYSPVRDESGGVGGVFCAVLETTDKVIEGRRLRLLNALGDATKAKTPSEACAVAAAQLAQAPSDIPFTLIYLLDESAPLAKLVGRANIEADHALAPSTVALEDAGFWPFEFDASTPRVVRFAAGPAGSRGAIILPIARAGGGRPRGFIVAGLSALLQSSESYDRFHSLLAASVGQVVSNAAAYEAERQRAEALAQIDRVKTTFFSNVSHEFRTPLTLILGPLEDALTDREHPLPSSQRERLSLMRRNGQRLLKLVNSLLDFSRLEAGSSQASFEPTDLGGFTTGVASAFDSVVSSAGMRLVVDCPPMPRPVHIDRDMWEKVVLNLISNAFKFTFEGEVSVSLRWFGSHVEMAVRDTGTGIPEDELPRIFERFHRVHGARGRSHEGTGIGLALVRELVKLHGGSIRVESASGRGSTFTVSLPTGDAHLAPGHVRGLQNGVSTRTAAEAFVHEASQWLSNAPTRAPYTTDVGVATSSQGRLHDAVQGQGHVLLADDNADMRDYMVRLLESRFSVEAVSDGSAALAAARSYPPDVVLTDVMMPGLDGFALVRELKADARTAHVPIMLLSARAGEEATVEGLTAGADDYLVKPFSARELVARVEGTVKSAKAKAERERLLGEVDAVRSRLQNLIQNAPAFVATLRGPEHVFEIVNAPYQRLVGSARKLEGRSVKDALPEITGQGFLDQLDRVYRTGEPFVGRELLAQLDRRRDGRLEDVFVNFVYQPRRDAAGRPEGIDVFGFEVTDQVHARHEAETLAEELRQRADFEQQLIGIVSHDLRNPISAILLGAAALLRTNDLSERQTKSIVRIQTSAERAHRMIRDLLDFTQARLAGGIVIERRAMDLHALVEDVLAEIEAAHPGRDLRISHIGDVRGEWDSDRLGQVVQNLVTNALKYSPDDSTVRVETRAEDNSAVLTVHNEGPSISPDRRQRLFQPLQRATGEVDKSGRSIGLGLYIVKQLIAAHGGSVAVDSTSEHGTTFTVRLPR